jgi:hypothetical protein
MREFDRLDAMFAQTAFFVSLGVQSSTVYAQ